VLHILGSCTFPESESGPGPYSQVKLLAMGLIDPQDNLKLKRVKASQFAMNFAYDRNTDLRVIYTLKTKGIFAMQFIHSCMHFEVLASVQ